MNTNLSEQLTQSMEDRLIAAIDARVGANNWDVKTLGYRLMAVTRPDGRTIYILDGEELIEFYPVEIETIQEAHYVTICAKQKYRMLGEHDGQ